MGAFRPRFGESDFLFWVRRVGPWFDPAGPAGQHLLANRRIDLTMQVGLYIAVEDPDTALYIGKVCRRDEGLQRRLIEHRQSVETWDALWLLPIRADASDDLVRTFELGMVRRYRPLLNKVGVRS